MAGSGRQAHSSCSTTSTCRAAACAGITEHGSQVIYKAHVKEILTEGEEGRAVCYIHHRHLISRHPHLQASSSPAHFPFTFLTFFAKYVATALPHHFAFIARSSPQAADGWIFGTM